MCVCVCVCVCVLEWGGSRVFAINFSTISIIVHSISNSTKQY